MKKILIATLCVSTFALTACDKKSTESPVTIAAASHLSHHNNADIKSDLTTLNTYISTQSQQKQDIQTKIKDATQHNDKAASKNRVKEAKDDADRFNQGLAQLKLKSSEVDALRNKTQVNNQLASELIEMQMSGVPDQAKITALTQKVEELQKDISEETQILETKIADIK